MYLSPFALALLLLLWPGSGFAALPKYMGVARCQTCHEVPPSVVFGRWAESSHAKAYKTLGTDKAKTLAQPLGVKDPQNSPACLVCHTTAYGEKPWRYSPSFTLGEGVGCEACHGGGQKYARFEVMSKVAMLRQRKPEQGAKFAAEFGLHYRGREGCASCHGQGRSAEGKNYRCPAEKPLDLEVALPLIRHWR